MSGDLYLDVERLIFDASGAFAKAKTSNEIDAAWKQIVRPVYGELSENALAILHRLYAANLTIILNGLGGLR